VVEGRNERKERRQRWKAKQKKKTG